MEIGDQYQEEYEDNLVWISLVEKYLGLDWKGTWLRFTSSEVKKL
jgi:hypothetical protein